MWSIDEFKMQYIECPIEEIKNKIICHLIKCTHCYANVYFALLSKTSETEMRAIVNNYYTH